MLTHDVRRKLWLVPAAAAAFTLALPGVAAADDPPPPHPTGTAISCDPGSPPVLSDTTCTVTVTDTSTDTPITPTGTVTFTPENEVTPISCALQNGQCAVTFRPSRVSGDTIAAFYGGDDTHTASAFGLRVFPAFRQSSTTVSCTPAMVVVGNPSTCTVTVTDTDAGAPQTPTGQVFFSSDEFGGQGTFSSSSCTLTNGQCVVTYTPAEVGEHDIDTDYRGDQLHRRTPTSFTATITAVPPRATSTRVSCNPSAPPVFSNTTCTATVSDNDAGSAITPTGTVDFTAGGGSAFHTSCTLNAGSCSVTYAPTVTTPHQVLASYAGDATHTASSGAADVQATLRSTSTRVSCAPVGLAVSTTTTCTVTVTDTAVGSAQTPLGSVDLSTDSPGTLSTATCSLLGGTCVVTYTPSATGSHTITASYRADAVHSGSVSSTTVTVVGRSTATTVSCTPAAPVVGSSTTCTATVSDRDAGTASTPTGSVSFSSGNVVVGVCTLAGSGSCGVIYTPGSVGLQAIGAAYAGDATHAGSQASTSIRTGYVFAWQGVADPPAVNTAKGGSTFSLAWSLTDGAAHFVSRLSAVASITYKSTSCTAFTTDPAGGTAADAPGASSLRYDPDANRYRFNWKTPKKGCYSLFVTLDSGQVIPSQFQTT